MTRSAPAWMVTLVTAALMSAALGASSPTTAPTREVSAFERQHAFDLARQSVQLLEGHRPTEAEAKLREALEILHGNPTWLYNLACIEMAEGKPDEAMNALEQATDAGFTDFHHLQHNFFLTPLRETPRYQKLLARQDEICHHAAQLALDELRARYGSTYLYEADEKHKLVFAVDADQPTLDALHQLLLEQMHSQQQTLFSNPSDEFIRIVVPSARDFRREVKRIGVEGMYVDDTRTLIAQRMGQVMIHEFTHALHAADQHAIGQVHPVWLREGLASMYEAGEFAEGTLTPADNYRLAFVQRAAKRNGLIPFEKLLHYTTEQFTMNANLAYGEASSLMLYLYEQGKLRDFYDTYKADYSKDESGKIALEKTSGMSLPALQEAWSKWMLARLAPSAHPGVGSLALGLRFVPENDGLKISLVLPTGPAMAAGLKTGDVIVGVDDRDVRDPASLMAAVSAHKGGDAVNLKVRRGTAYSSISVKLANR